MPFLAGEGGNDTMLAEDKTMIISNMEYHHWRMTMLAMVTMITMAMMMMMMIRMMHAGGSGQHVVERPIHAATTAGKRSG